MGLSHQVWSHGGSTFKKNTTLNDHFSRPAQTDPYLLGHFLMVTNEQAKDQPAEHKASLLLTSERAHCD